MNERRSDCICRRKQTALKHISSLSPTINWLFPISAHSNMKFHILTKDYAACLHRVKRLFGFLWALCRADPAINRNEQELKRQSAHKANISSISSRELSLCGNTRNTSALHALRVLHNFLIKCTRTRRTHSSHLPCRTIDNETWYARWLKKRHRPFYKPDRRSHTFDFQIEYTLITIYVFFKPNQWSRLLVKMSINHLISIHFNKHPRRIRPSAY